MQTVTDSLILIVFRGGDLVNLRPPLLHKNLAFHDVSGFMFVVDVNVLFPLRRI
jgi:hypothetical protein